jgi:hypothetical protein
MLHLDGLDYKHNLTEELTTTDQQYRSSSVSIRLPVAY